MATCWDWEPMDYYRLVDADGKTINLSSNPNAFPIRPEGSKIQQLYERVKRKWIDV